MKKILISTIAVSALLFTVGCNTDFDNDVNDVTVTKGDADFTKYVSLGNSLTAGYRDGTLYSDGQNESYPSMLAKQMQLAGGGAFTQPMMPNNVGGFSNLFTASGGKSFYGKLTLKVVDGSLSPVPSAPAADLDNVSAKGPYNNMGVPGARVAHLLAPGYGSLAGLATKTANPYFVRFASSATTSVIDDFLAQKPTFFSLWIGNNDALLYALDGGDPTDQPLTPPAQFAAYYSALMQKIGTTNAKGVLANIPNVTTIPSLTTIPYNPITSLVLGKGNQAAGDAAINQLNAQLYGPLVQILSKIPVAGAKDRIKLLSKTEANPMLINDESLVDIGPQITFIASQNPSLAPLAAYLGATYGKARQTQAGDLTPLTTKAAIGTLQTLPAGVPASLGTRGIAYPFADRYVLTATEVEEVNTTIAAYNATIKAAAGDKYAFVDANAKMTELNSASGLQWDGVRYTAKFVTGGAFSLDGVHPTGRGYAVLANEFIKAINGKYHSTLPYVNANMYSGVTFP